jgi:hypothetical protein
MREITADKTFSKMKEPHPSNSTEIIMEVFNILVLQLQFLSCPNTLGWLPTHPAATQPAQAGRHLL